MLELYSCVNEVNNFLDELENSFQILEGYFTIFYTTPNVMTIDTYTFMFNVHHLHLLYHFFKTS